MEDTEMTPAEDLPPANLQKQDPPAPAPALAQNGNTSTDGNLHKLPPADDIQFPPSHDNDAIAAATAAAPPHKDDTSDARALLQTQPNLSSPLPQKKHSASKSKHDSAAKSKRVWTDLGMGDADESGTPEEQDAFMREVETFYRDNGQELKPPKFYGEPLNLLKLWRAVIKLGGYDVVTASKLWRQVGESFHPPKTCTTVSWTFRIFYEKALLEFEKHKRQSGELQLPGSPPHPHQSACAEKETSGNHKTSSGRARRDAATRAMKIWNSPRVAGYGEASEPVVQDKNSNSTPRREKPLKSIDCLRLVKSNQEHAEKPACIEADKEVDTEIADAGQPADWVKINVREAKDCYEIYALVPGLLREEVRVQSDPAGRLVITGQPEQLDNPWGIKPFKKIITLPSKIDPLQTSAVVSLHGRLYVRVPFEQGSA